MNDLNNLSGGDFLAGLGLFQAFKWYELLLITIVVVSVFHFFSDSFTIDEDDKS
ncbi:MAG: hypothetical protein OIF32_07890 [Campylobacterales bacterium]|nr:hypothetical protein [Campylobacterales bacterium]